MLGQRDGGDVSKCNVGTAVRVLVVPPCDAPRIGLRLMQNLVAVPTCGTGIRRRATSSRSSPVSSA
jgi:hypothetical protein